MWSALGYGIAGLGAVLAFLAYSLLARPHTDRVPVYVFMAFSLLVICLGLGSEFMKFHYDNLAKNADAFELGKDARNRDVNIKVTNISGELDRLKALITSARDRAHDAETQTSNHSGCLMYGQYSRSEGDKALIQLETVRGEVSSLKAL